MGFLFAGDPLMEMGSFEATEMRIIASLLVNTDVLINIGANIGYYCCLALSMGKHAVAFEPIELNLRCLYKNIAANNWTDRIEVFPIAVGSTIGLIPVYGANTGASLIKGWAGISENQVRLAPISTLDIVLGSRFSSKRCLVVMDVEGAEYDVLLGARHFLEQQPRAQWMVEICVAEHQPHGVVINPNLLSTFEIFWERGYDAWTASSEPRPVKPPEVKAIALGGPNTLHTHNFFFTEKGRALPALAMDNISTPSGKEAMP